MRRLTFVFALTACFAAATQSVCGQGIALRGVGAVNESMAGAAVAAPIDAAGAIHWNPASISEFQHNEATLGMALVLPSTQVASTVFTRGFSESEPGVSPVPTIAIVHKTNNPRVTFGLGAYGIAGFKVNYDASATNAILAPQGALAPLPSFGRLNTEADFFQIAPTLSFALSDRVSIGVAPTLTLGRIALNPLFAAPLVGGVYPDSSGTRYHFGGGAQFGIYMAPSCHWRVGASVKTTQWMEEFRYRFNGGRTTAKFDYPMIISVGTSYTGIPGVVWALDVRYFDYDNTDGFGTSGFNADGSVAGVGWRGVFSVATGIQKRINGCTTLRIGHVFNTNPIEPNDVLINVGAPLITENITSIGISRDITCNLSANLAYLHAWENTEIGPYAPGTPTSIEITTSADLISASLTVKW